MHNSVYFLSLSKTEEWAKISVDEFIGYNFISGSIDEDRAISKLSDVRHELVALLEESGRELQKNLERFDEERRVWEVVKNKNKMAIPSEYQRSAEFVMGESSKQIYRICQQKLCRHTPFWNLNSEDWELPEEDTKDGFIWYVVPVILNCLS